MNASKLIVDKETELLALHKALMEAKFSLNPSDKQVAASPYTTELTQRVLETIIQFQSYSNPAKRDSWSNWLENKKEWIWRRSLSNILKYTPFRWDEMTMEFKADYVQWLFSPYNLSEEDIIQFIEEYESYRDRIDHGSGADLKGFGHATNEMLDELERKLNRQLPEDYKQFLREYNGGTVLVHYCIFVVEELNEAVPLEVLFGMDLENRYDLVYRNSFEDDLPSGYLVIGETAEVGKLLLGTGIENQGIYYWSNRYQDDPTSEKGLYKLTDRFESFKNSWKKMIKTL